MVLCRISVARSFATILTESHTPACRQREGDDARRGIAKVSLATCSPLQYCIELVATDEISVDKTSKL